MTSQQNIINLVTANLTKRNAGDLPMIRQALNGKLCNSPEAADSQGEKGTGSK